MDPELSTVTFDGSSKLVRGVGGKYPFTLKLTLGASTYDIVAPATGYTNFKFAYIYCNRSVSTYNAFQHLGSPLFTEIEMAEARKGIVKNSGKNVKMEISTGPTDNECENLTFVCFALENTLRPTFNDTNKDNNVKCFDIASAKECFPGM